MRTSPGGSSSSSMIDIMGMSFIPFYKIIGPFIFRMWGRKWAEC
jgi:hypothetical protein